MSISARRIWVALFMALAIILGPLMPPPTSAHAQEATPVPQEARTIKDAQLRWSINDQLQKRPPVGGVNYLTAGISDGKKGTYSASDGAVAIKIINGDSVTSPTWNTKANGPDPR